MKRYNGYLNSDCFPKDSEMKFLYETDELLKFVSKCLGISPIYRWADPLACHDKLVDLPIYKLEKFLST